MGLTTEDDHPYIKIFDVGRQIVTNRLDGFLPSRIVFFLNNLHIIPRPIYLTRHGQSEYNVDERLGGDPPLTEKGHMFTVKLREFMEQQPFDAETQLIVWSSTMLRAVQTAEGITCAQHVRWKSMEEIDVRQTLGEASLSLWLSLSRSLVFVMQYVLLGRVRDGRLQVGVCDGMTYEEFERQLPEEFAARAKDKLRYRYPRGESYEDLIRRLDPIIIELERQRNPLLIVAHQAVLRCLYAYFADFDREQVPHLQVPSHTVICLKPQAYGTSTEHFVLL